MSANLLMLQGTGSSVGKSALVAGLCRLYQRRGLKVAPFKAQNMALNSFITAQGDEIGRAQAVQAEACRLAPQVDMNPVLIKPNSDVGAQVIVHGKPVANMSAVIYHDYKETAWRAVTESLARLRNTYDLVIIEGAGSPAEINLRDKDIVNMGLATRVKAPVLLIGDIDKGGVFASLVGTLALLEEDEKALIKGFIINKFRGDVTLLEPGLKMITDRCGVPFVGVVPWFGKEIYIPEEDGVALEKGVQQSCHPRISTAADATLAIGVIRLPHISNFTDFDPLLHEADVRLDYLEPDSALPGYHLIILPGSKNTLEDLAFLQKFDLPRRLKAFVEVGGAVVGICGGFQMMGNSLSDPAMIESGHGQVDGFGLLPINTVMASEKITLQCRARLATPCFGSNLEVTGYEIHQGRTAPDGPAQELLRVTPAEGEPYGDGFIAEQGRVWGSYMHGIFDDDRFRAAYLGWLRENVANSCPSLDGVFAGVSYQQRKEDGFNALADLLQRSLDMRAIDKVAGL